MIKGENVRIMIGDKVVGFAESAQLTFAEDDADTKSQTYAMSAFRTIEEHWRREKQLEKWKKHPVMHIQREFQVHPMNFEQIQELSQKGVILQWSYDVSRNPTISIMLNDNHTTVEDHGWLLQDMEGRWWGMDSGYHRMLEEYKKIVIERYQILHSSLFTSKKSFKTDKKWQKLSIMPRRIPLSERFR